MLRTIWSRVVDSSQALMSRRRSPRKELKSHLALFVDSVGRILHIISLVNFICLAIEVAFERVEEHRRVFFVFLLLELHCSKDFVSVQSYAYKEGCRLAIVRLAI